VDEVRDDAGSSGSAVRSELAHTEARDGEAETQKTPPVEGAAFLSPPQQPGELGRLGNYRVLKVLGQGGMGMVYQAEDVQLRRQVALKVMLPRLSANPRASTRFLREARAAAAIEHDHIIPILHVGEERGVPYLAMPLLRGQSLAERLRASPRPPVRDVLRIGREIAEGLAAAHARGLIHRDIKPANIWLEGPACEAGAGARVKILDFGLARPVREEDTVADAASHSADDQDATLQGTIVGTPAYMSPEQATGGEVDSRCDLFSLGCVLYLLCTGEQPFTGKNVLATLKAVATHRPVAPRELRQAIPRELSDLVMQLLEKNPADRPESAQAVARQLRSLGHEVRARAARSRSRRWWLAMGAGLVLFAGLLTTALLVGFNTAQGTLILESIDPNVQVTIMRDGQPVVDRAGPGTLSLRAGQYLVKIVEPRDSDLVPTPPEFTLGDSGKVFVRIDHARNDIGPPIARRGPAPPCAADALQRANLSEAALANFGQGDPRAAPAELIGVLGDPRFRIPGRPHYPAFSPDGASLVVPSGEDFRLFDVASGACRKVFHPAAGRANALAISPDGALLATGGGDGIINLWDVKTGNKLRSMHRHRGSIYALAFAPGGHVLASVSNDGAVRVWDVAQGQQLYVPQARSNDERHGVAFSSDGQWLVAGCRDGKVHVWETGAYALKHTLVHRRDGSEMGVALSPDGKVLATGSKTCLKLWDASALGSPSVRLLHTDDALANWLAFNPDSSVLFTGPRHANVTENSITSRDVATGKELGSVTLDIAGGWACYALSPDGKTVAALAKSERVLQLFDSQTGEPRTSQVGHRQEVRDIVFSPDGRYLASGGHDRTARIWDLAAGKQRVPPLKGHTSSVWSVVYSPDGKRLASGSGDRSVRVWDPDNGKLEHVLKEHSGEISQIAFSPDGRRIAAGMGHGAIRFWNVRTGKEIVLGPVLHREHIRCVAFSPDGTRVASCGRDGRVIISDTGNGAVLGQMSLARDASAVQVQYSPDGQTIAASSDHPDSVARLWSPLSNQVVNLSGHGGHIQGLAFRPDGFMLATACTDDSLRLWEVGANPPRKRVLAMGCFGQLASVAFSPDGRYLATGNPDGTIALFRLSAPAENVGEWLQAQGGPPGPGLTGDAWLKAVAGLSAGNLVQAVSDRLRELNPEFDGVLRPTIENGAVVGLEFSTVKVANIQPLAAVRTLRRLDCSGHFGQHNGRLRDLLPLSVLKLEALVAHDNQITDLAPLAGMPLRKVELHYCPVGDLSPLRGAPLESIDLGGTAVASVEPLRGMRLERLLLWESQVADLAPLAGISFRVLVLGRTKVTTFESLQGCRVQELDCRDLHLSDYTMLEKLDVEQMDAGRIDGVPPPVPAASRLRRFIAQSRLTGTDARDRLKADSAHKVHPFSLIAGNTYTIDMTSDLPGEQFDPFLRLEDAEGNQRAFNDNGGGNRNARIIFRCPRSGLYRIIATTAQRATGDYRLTITVSER
jgi:WD40 repeat protein/serine/threonine protein kinase